MDGWTGCSRIRPEDAKMRIWIWMPNLLLAFVQRRSRRARVASFCVCEEAWEQVAMLPLMHEAAKQLAG